MRSIETDILMQLRKNVIPQALSRLQKEVPILGDFEKIAVCFDIPYRMSVGKIVIVSAGSGYPGYRRLDVEIDREDIGANCQICAKFGKKRELIAYLSQSDAAELLAQKFYNGSEVLADRYDNVGNDCFENMWEDIHYIESQFENRFPLTKEAKRLYFDLKRAENRYELNELLKEAAARDEGCRFVDPSTFQGYGLSVQFKTLPQGQHIYSESDIPYAGPSSVIVRVFNFNECVTVTYIG